MDDLIKALQILRKYGNPKYPTNCSYDVLFVDINPADVSTEDIKELETLGFFVSDEDDDGFTSFKFGSC